MNGWNFLQGMKKNSWPRTDLKWHGHLAPLKNSLRLVYELEGCLAISADFQMSHASFSNHMTHDLSSYSDRSEFCLNVRMQSFTFTVNGLLIYLHTWSFIENQLSSIYLYPSLQKCISRCMPILSALKGLSFFFEVSSVSRLGWRKTRRNEAFPVEILVSLQLHFLRGTEEFFVAL